MKFRRNDKLPMKIPERVRHAVRLGFEFEAGILERFPGKNLPGNMLRLTERTDLLSPKYGFQLVHLDFGFEGRKYMGTADQLLNMHPGRFETLPETKRHIGLLVLCAGFTLDASEEEFTDAMVDELLAGGQELPPNLGSPFRTVTTVMSDGWICVLMRREGEPVSTVVAKPGTLPLELDGNQLLGPLGWLNEKILTQGA